MLRLINLKENSPTVDYALAVVEIEIENASKEGVSVIKVLHGYGSHGRGGAILIALRARLRELKKQGKIRDYFGGDKWSHFTEPARQMLQTDKSIASDEDLGKANPGITLIWV
ncbi:MAG: hypothetical protein NC218_12270 [Acetobacter sp.]|nr:hypothetical protein [Acetobacter sp.]